MNSSFTPKDLCRILDVEFSSEQLRAICVEYDGPNKPPKPLEPGVIIASAGTGKTTVMAARVVWLVKSGLVSLNQVLGLTFTRKAAASMARKIANDLVSAGIRQLGQDEAAEAVSTYDAFAGKLVDEFGMLLGVDNRMRILTQAEQIQMITNIVNATPPSPDMVGWLQALDEAEVPDFALPTPMVMSQMGQSSLVQAIQRLDEGSRSHLVSAQDVRDDAMKLLDAVTPELRELEELNNKQRGYKTKFEDFLKVANAAALNAELSDLVENYRNLKEQRRCTTFADQLNYAAQLATNFPEIGKQMRERYKVVLLDEYQDTSGAQVSLLQALFSGSDAEHGRGFPVTAVGDPNQGIYGWRGASSSNITAFPEAFPRADGTPAHSFTLKINRRSHLRILEAGNQMIPASEPLLLHPSQDPDLQPHKRPLATAGELAIGQFATFQDELAYLVEEIQEYHDRGKAWKDIAVLCRTNSPLRQIFQHLITHDIPAEIVGLKGLLYLPEIHAVVSLLGVLSSPDSNLHMASLLSSPRFPLTATDMAELGRQARRRTAASTDDALDGWDAITRDALASASEVAGSLYQAAVEVASNRDTRISPAGQKTLRELVGIVHTLRRYRFEPLTDVVQRAISLLGSDTQLMLSGQHAYLQQFVEHVADFSQHDDANLAGLLNYLDVEMSDCEGMERAHVSAQDSVKLLTVHAAKGLDWPVVFVPYLVELTFPVKRSQSWPSSAGYLSHQLRQDKESIPQLREPTHKGLKDFLDEHTDHHQMSEARLAYVAMTRAKEALLVSSHLFRPGAPRKCKPSRYLTSLVENYVHQVRYAQPLAGETPRTPELPEGVRFTGLLAAPHEQLQKLLTVQESLTDEDFDAVSTAFKEALEGNAYQANPVPTEHVSAAWPATLELTSAQQEAIKWITEARQLEASNLRDWVLQSGTAADDVLPQLERWEFQTQRLIEAAQPTTEVHLPRGLSASAVLQMQKDPQAYARQLLRPMPYRPSSGADIGTSFHRWVENRFSLASTLEELDERAHPEQLENLIQQFVAGQFGDRQPLAVEVPFVFTLDNFTMRGKMDAVYAWDGEDYDVVVVDWKTMSGGANPLQLAIYRHAWAEAKKLDPRRVGAAFYYVPTDHLEFSNATVEDVRRTLQQATGADA